MTKIARTPPSSSTGGRTRGPGLPVSKDAVNACWQKGIGFSHIPYSKNFCFKSLGVLGIFQILTVNSQPRCPAGGGIQSGLTNTRVPAFLFRSQLTCLGTKSAKDMLSPGPLGLPPVSLHQGASEYPRKDSTLGRWRRRIARRLLRLA